MNISDRDNYAYAICAKRLKEQIDKDLLDRLRDAMIETHKILKNAKKVVEEYKEGNV